MKSKFLKTILAFALISPVLAHSENYAFNFNANPRADGSGALSINNDIAFKLLVSTALIPSISISTLNRSEYWKNGGFILEMSHNGKTVRLNDAIISPAGPLKLGNDGFFEIYSNIDDFFDIDFHPGASFVDNNGLSYDAFVYGQIDVYNNQEQFQDFFAIATTGDTSDLKNYVLQVPEPPTVGMWLLGAMALFYSRKQKKA
ncbi:PEP-CTERM sorting domain-containing protein [Zoogloea sp.]|uniref:PEP-CTERM sorting domain-containing protein n=1 Tax=Zoogloea sp. TaxID=49181 RepID=UPI0035B49BA3